MKKLLATILAVLLFASPAWAAFPVVQTTNTSLQNSETSTQTVALPASITAGDLLVIVVTVSRQSATTTPSSFITTPAGWTAVFGLTGASSDGVGDIVTRIFSKVATGSEGASVSVTSASRRGSHHSFRINGTSGAAASIECATGTASADTDIDPDPATVTPSWGAKDTLFIAVAAKETGLTTAPTAPTNYSNVLNATNDAGGVNTTTTSTARRELNAASDNPGIFDYVDGGDRWLATTCAVEPAAATGRPIAPIIFQ